jgi:XTP/dITP diphosphohydrolase
LSGIFFATSNLGKLKETKELLLPLGFEVEQLKVPYPEIQGPSLEEVAEFGIKWIQKEEDIKGAVMLEDAGLFIQSLSDFPGVYSKFVFTTIGCKGVLRLLEGKDDRSAYFKSIIAYCSPGSSPKIFKGRVDGEIARESKGEHGFGYDPIFIPQGETRTFAQMETKEKNQFSHRAHALGNLAEFLKKV